jgi:hypothetical protein
VDFAPKTGFAFRALEMEPVAASTG